MNGGGRVQRSRLNKGEGEEEVWYSVLEVQQNFDKRSNNFLYD